MFVDVLELRLMNDNEVSQKKWCLYVWVFGMRIRK